MSFVLKTNNRKYESGSTLIAKIVTPDKSKVSYLKCPVKIQPQTISDEDAVIRDLQIIESTLNANDWNNITEEIEYLSVAINSVTNGSHVSEPIITNSQISQDGVNVQIINNSGKVLHRPLYDVNKEDDYIGQKCTLIITVSKGSASRTLQKDFIVPAYTADDVLGIIKAKISEVALWGFIKNNNESANNIFSDLKNLNDETNVKNFFEKCNINLSDYATKNSMPKVTTTYFNTTLGGFDNTGVITRLKANEAFDAASTDPLLKPCTDSRMIVKDDVSNTILDALGLDSTEVKRGITIAYRTQFLADEKNKIETKITLEGGNLPVNYSVNNIAILSEKISINDIMFNITSATRASWVTPFYSDYGLSDSIINNSQASNRLNIEVSSGQNVIISLPSSLRNLPGGIPDAKHIGYSVDSVGNMSGFADSFIYFSIYTNTKMNVVNQTEIATVTDNLKLLSSTTELAANTPLTSSNTPKYLYIDSTDPVPGSGIDGVLEIHCYDSVLGKGKILSSIYFHITKTS